MQLEKTESIIEKLENGKTLTEICKDKNYPSLSVVYRKMRDDDKFHKMIMKAREVGTFTILDQIHEMLTKPQDPKYFQQTRELAHHARWLASKLASGIFGDKIKQEVKADNNITISWGNPRSQKRLPRLLMAN